MTRIILIGFMGSGKTTLGTELAERLSLPFVDTDLEIERFEEKSIDRIFRENGEERFRFLEKQLIDILSTIDTDYVLAVGGGLPCNHDLMPQLKRMGQTIYLKCSPELLAKRLMNDTTVRPLIDGVKGADLVRFIEEKLQEREVVYNQADVILEDEHSIEAILRRLLPRKN